jgi:ABC-2 type transport system permease protein
MHKFFAVFKREYLERVRTRWFLIATVFGPVVFGGLMFLPAYLSGRGKVSNDVARIRILDGTESDMGRRIAAELNGGLFGDTSKTQVTAVTPATLARAESTATADVIGKRLIGYLVLDRGVLNGSNPRYAGTNATAMIDMRQLEAAVRREVFDARLVAAGVSVSNAQRLARMRFELNAERITPSGRGGSGQISILVAITIAMLLYITIFIYGQNVLRGVIDEKQSRVAEVVVSSVRPGVLLAGKVFGVGAVGATQLVIWLSTALLMARFRTSLLRMLGVDALPLQIPGFTLGVAVILLLFFVLGFTFYAALFAAVGSMCNSEQDAQQAQMPVAMLLVVSIMFLQPVLGAPEGLMARNLSWVPFSAPIMMPLRMSAVNVPAWDIALSLCALLAACYLALWVAARIYRTGLLMYGKRPSFGEVVRWVRESR